MAEEDATPDTIVFAISHGAYVVSTNAGGVQVNAQLGADFNNVFNHPLFSPNADAGGGGGTFALLGDFNVAVDQKTGKLLPITDITPNPDFGRLISSFSQEGIDSRRTVRLRLRITF